MKYYLIAGEASGDLHGANLMKALYEQDQQADIRFWGGDAMQAVGGTMVKHIKDLAYMGFAEVVMHLGAILGNLRLCKQDLLEFAPDAVIYIDYPSFNLRIAKFAHRHGLKNFHYISPNLWAWKKGRIKAMRRDLDKLYCILPFEQEFYKKNNFPQAEFVGHPLLDAVPESQDRSAQGEGCKQVALLPGSRKQELKRMLPLMTALARRHPEMHFVIAGVSLLGKEAYLQYMGQRPTNVEIALDSTYAVLQQSDAAIVKSGTATLETALLGVPQAVCYRANPISIALARKLVSKRIQYISLVNLIADKPVVKELIQEDMSLTNMEAELESIVNDGTTRQQMLDDYAEIRHLLGDKGASLRTAQSIYRHLTK